MSEDDAMTKPEPPRETIECDNPDCGCHGTLRTGFVCPRAIAPAPTPEPPHDPEGVNSMVRGMLADTPETPCESIPFHDVTMLTPRETPSALSAAEFYEVSWDTEILTETDALAFAEAYAADLRSKLSTAERERNGLREDIELVAKCPVCESPYSATHKADCRLSGYNLPQIYALLGDLRAAEAELARVRKALTLTLQACRADAATQDDWHNSIVKQAEAALRTGGEPK